VARGVCASTEDKGGALKNKGVSFFTVFSEGKGKGQCVLHSGNRSSQHIRILQGRGHCTRGLSLLQFRSRGRELGRERADKHVLPSSPSFPRNSRFHTKL